MKRITITASIFVILAAAFLLWISLRDKRVIEGEVQDIRIYQGQGSENVTEFLYLGSVNEASKEKFIRLVNAAKKENAHSNLTLLNDFDAKMVAKSGKASILHFQKHDGSVSFYITKEVEGKVYTSPELYSIRGSSAEEFVNLLDSFKK